MTANIASVFKFLRFVWLKLLFSYMKVFVDFRPVHDMVPHPDANLEESINEV